MPIDTGQQWVLAGRESELGAAGAALRQGGGVLLTGGSGVGRTRLLAAVLEKTAAAGRAVVTVGGVGGRRGSGAVRAFGSVAECLRWLRQSGGGQRVVLGCDDAHLLDEADAHRVYRTAAAGQLAVAATVRQDARHPVGVDRLWVEQLVERVEVAPFDRTATAAVLRARLGGRLDAGSLERLWSATQGNALVLRELVEHALDEGALRREQEVWSWSGLAGDPPRRLADVLLLWLRDLSAQEEELVGMLAVAEPLEADAVARRGLASAAEALSRRGVVRVEQTGRRVLLRLALPLAGRTVVSRMPALTARRLRLQAAEAVEDGERTGPDEVLRTVALRVAAGLVPERRLLLEAARTAVRRQEFARAEQLCRLVTDEDSGERGDHGEQGAGRAEGGSGEVALLLGQVLAGQGRHEEAEEVFASVRGCQGGAAGRAGAVAARVANLAFGLGRVETAAAVLEEERGRLGDAGAGSLLTARAVLAVLADRLPEAVAAGEAVVGLSGPGQVPAGGEAVPDPAGRGEGVAGGPAGSSGGTEAGDGAGVAGLLPVVAFARAELGDPGGASALLASRARQAEAWPEEALLDFRSVAAHCALVQGDLRAAGTAVARLVRGAAGAGRLGQLRAWVYQARLLRRRGRPEDAAALLWQAGAVRAGYDWLTSPSWVLAQLAGALAEAGRHGEALRTLAEARSAQRAGVGRPVLDDAVGFERAVVLAHAGDRSGAAAQALEVAGRAEAGGRLPAAIAALHLAARVTDAAPSAARVQRLALRCRAEEARLQAEQVRALARGDAEALVTVAGRFRSLAALPAAAEAAEQAGRVHRAAGRRRKGRLASAAARELCARFGGALPPWAEPGERGSEATAALTTREREVAALAAGGLPNREIADRLVVSVRTVENHLHRVYHKLGVVQRADLAELLVTRPVPGGGGAGAVGAGRAAQAGRAARPRPRPAGAEERGRCAMCAQPLGSAG
ncbi:LuxR C-terminal-related transcriptional regulator [Streptomyces althioticus]|uniref:LuxR C-terminal-related transcriptional regulator n=1 Tax=Streptomyces althioticus TaxID=83380 RepID=UPI0036AACDC9